MIITAEALLAGIAEREIADERERTGFKLFGARWRPVLWTDIVKQPLHTPTRSAVGFGWEICTRPSCQQTTRVVHHREGFTPRSVFRRPELWVPRSCQADVESLDCGDRIRRTASSTSPKMAKPDHRTQTRCECHILISGQEKPDENRPWQGPRGRASDEPGADGFQAHQVAHRTVDAAANRDKT